MTWLRQDSDVWWSRERSPVCPWFFGLSRLACGASLWPKPKYRSLHLCSSLMGITDTIPCDEKILIVEISSVLVNLGRCCNGPLGSLHLKGAEQAITWTCLVAMWHAPCVTDDTAKGTLRMNTRWLCWHSVRGCQGAAVGEWGLVQPLRECLQPAHLWEEMFRLGPDVFLRNKISTNPDIFHILRMNKQEKWVCNKEEANNMNGIVQMASLHG